MPEGTVKWYDQKKGYGFITRVDTGEDVFVHYTAINKDGYKTLDNGQKVMFDVENGPKGLKAANVKPV
ncbi:MAG: cold-shock protein [Caldisericia bacterium]|nr:cold-shock protein [Caldisericia bacterium]